MKNLVLVILAVITMTTVGIAQTVYESLTTLSRTYKPLFGKETSSLSIDLIRQYTLSATDTVYYVSVKVDQKVAEVTGYSIGASLFGSNLAYGGAASGSRSYVFQKENGL